MYSQKSMYLYVVLLNLVDFFLSIPTFGNELLELLIKHSLGFYIKFLNIYVLHFWK